MLDARGDGPPEALVHLTGGGEGGGRHTLFGLSSGGRQMTTHLLDGEFPKYRSLLPAGHEATAELPRAELSEAVRRVALVAERNSPVRLTFSGSELVLQASGIDDAAAEESLGVEFSGDELTIAFNPTYLLDGLGALETDTVQLGFTAATRPALLTAKGEDTQSDYRYLIMPVRLPG
jgi:DNA polymerase-3 subunit beta